MRFDLGPVYAEGYQARLDETQAEQNPWLSPFTRIIWQLGWDDADKITPPMAEAVTDEFPTHPFVEGNDNG